MRLNNIKLMRAVVLGVLMLLWGCGGVSDRRGAKASGRNGVEWKLRSRNVQRHTYTKEGLLDSSYETSYFEVGGRMLSGKSVKRRQYEGRRLVDEKEFTLKEDSGWYLSSEIVCKYDPKGNKIAETQKMEGETVLRMFYQYNDKGQVVQKLTVYRPLGSRGAGDSTNSIYIYDGAGHQISDIITHPLEQGRTVRIILYKGGEKQSQFAIGPEGDTLEKFRFERDGELEKEISLMQTPGDEDTIWYREEKIVKMIGHMDLKRKKIRTKDVYQYDEKGNETASFYYEAPL
jgi:hypothetical protein